MDSSATFVVEVLLDGQVARLIHARDYRPDIKAAGYGSGCFGFGVTLDAEDMASHAQIEARVANLGIPVGRPLDLVALGRGGDDVRRLGWVEWMGGLRINGWLTSAGEVEPSDLPIISAFVDGNAIATTKPRGWRHVKGQDEGVERALAFDLYLPQHMVDGRLHRVTVMAGQEELQGSPVALMAFDDGVARHLKGAGASAEVDWLRAHYIDRVAPMSMPFTAYDEWRQRYPVPAPSADGLPPLAVVLAGPGCRQTIESLEHQTHQDWTASLISGQAEALSFDCEEMLAFVRDTCDPSSFVLFAASGTVFAEGALARVADAIRKHPDAVIVYGDVDILGPDGQRCPLFFPTFDYERFLEQGYCAHLFGARASDVELALTNGATDFYETFFALLEDGPPDPAAVVHLPGSLATLPAFDRGLLSERLARAARDHLSAHGVRSAAEPSGGSLLPAVHIRRSGVPTDPSVSILIPTRNRVDLLRPCLASIAAADTKHIGEILVIDNGSTDDETLQYLEDQERGGAIRVLRDRGPFNYSRLNNAAVRVARSPYVCLLNNDVEVITPDWLEDMLSRLLEPDVGAVGAMLLWASGVVQHGGVVLGMQFAADHAFADRMGDTDPGYGDLLRVAHQCSAVTAACLLTRKADYEALGGLDETFFPVAFNDVDYCLQLRARGRRVIFTPHARLFHHESVSRGPDTRRDRQRRAQRELAALRARWQDVLAADPCFSPGLALDPYPYSGLAWPPRSMEPRLPLSPPPLSLPPGF